MNDNSAGASMDEAIISPLLATIPGIQHGFGCRKKNVPPSVAPYWEQRATKRQVHGARVVQVSEYCEDVGDADGLITYQPGLVLSIPTADCIPVLLARVDGGAIAALHIGWRGAYEGIVHEFGGVLAGDGEDLSRWVAALGPCAQGCCYEVSEQLIDDFEQKVKIHRAAFSPQPRKLSLTIIVQTQLTCIGVARHSNSGECTICGTERVEGASPRFHSYRRDTMRDPSKDLQYAAIVLAP